jgi:hypothetical protein
VKRDWGKFYGGAGVVGLTHSFLLAGENAVSASLWSVEDSSTANFMVGVYKMVEEEGLTYAKTINEMKRTFINVQVSVDKFDSTRGLVISELKNSQSNQLSHPLFDSILRQYSISTFLVWKTQLDIRHTCYQLKYETRLTSALFDNKRVHHRAIERI